MKVFVGIKELLTFAGAAKKNGRHIVDADFSIIKNAAIVEDKGRIVWVGPEKNWLTEYSHNTHKKNGVQQKKSKLPRGVEIVDLKADCVIPAFSECHTHLVFAGDRKDEFEKRNQGLSYQEISQAGGGIKSTVRQTRSATPKQLLTQARARADIFFRQGVTTLEVKSGYGLTHDDEIKILKVIKSLATSKTGPRVIATYLGPHAVPEAQSADAYLNEILKKTLPYVAKHKLAQRVDMFIEDGYYSLEMAKRYFSEAMRLDFDITAHADQIKRCGGGEYLAGLSAKATLNTKVKSVDHLVQVNDADIKSLAQSQTTCVLLPTSDFYLRLKYPPARKMIDEGARVALATDFNPGTSPTQDLSFVGALARLEMKMTLAEVLSAYILGSAYALGVENDLGSLEIGKLCDFAVVEGGWRDLFYQVGQHPVKSVCRAGNIN